MLASRVASRAGAEDWILTTERDIQGLTTGKLVLRRLRSDWRLMLSVFLGILVATLLMSAAPVYLDALERQSIKGAIGQEVSRWGGSFFDITVESRFVPLDGDDFERSDLAHGAALEENATPIIAGTHRYVRTLSYPVLVMRQPSESGEESDAPTTGMEVGLFQHLEGLEDRVAFVEGRAPEDIVLNGEDGPVVEAVVSSGTAEEFGGIRVGDVLVVAPSMDSPSKVSARVVGIVVAGDPEDPYWQNRPDAFLSPRVPDDQGVVTADSPPLLGVFVGRDALIEAMRTAFPGATVDTTWYNSVDTDALATWSSDEMRDQDGVSAVGRPRALDPGLYDQKRHQHHAGSDRTSELPEQRPFAPAAGDAGSRRPVLPIHDRVVPRSQPRKRHRALQKPRHGYVAAAETLSHRRGDPDGVGRRDCASHRAAHSLAGRAAPVLQTYHRWKHTPRASELGAVWSRHGRGPSMPISYSSFRAWWVRDQA